MTIKNTSANSVSGLETITLFDFISLVSEAFIPTVNTVMGNKKQFFDIHDRKIKELFFCELDDIIQSKSKPRHTIIIINTCIPVDNWRSNNSGSGYPYHLIDESLNVTDRKLFDTLEGFWKLLSKKASYITIRNKELDSNDLANIIVDLIGKSHINNIETNYDEIQDLNSLFANGNKAVPDYLKEEVERLLRNKNLIV